MQLALQSKVDEVKAMDIRFDEERALAEQDHKKQFSEMVADFQRRERELTHELSMVRAQKDSGGETGYIACQLQAQAKQAPITPELTAQNLANHMSLTVVMFGQNVGEWCANVRVAQPVSNIQGHDGRSQALQASLLWSGPGKPGF